ncbi:MAG: cytochrome c3 family protein [Bryobacteraceae bacterium]
MTWGAAPAAFSHKRHETLKIPCVNCHAEAMKAERAGFPEVEKCLVCHKRDGDGRAGLPGEVLDHIPSQRLYNLPDFVFFSHARHGAAKVECRSCHGDVAARDVLAVEHPPTMKACIACHRERKAAVGCTTCHELGQ